MESQSRLHKLCELYKVTPPPDLKEHDMTPEESKLYWDMVIESEGFDVPFLPGCNEDGLITPQPPIEPFLEGHRPYAEAAIQKYNTDQNIRLQLKEVEKVNLHCPKYFTYYLTFTAKNADDNEIKTYESKLFEDYEGELHIEFMREKSPRKNGYKVPPSSVATGSGCSAADFST